MSIFRLSVELVVADVVVVVADVVIVERCPKKAQGPDKILKCGQWRSLDCGQRPC